MKPFKFLIAVAAAAAIAACGGDRTSDSNEPITAKVVPPPEGGDWTKVVAQTDEGGFRMGNPDAAVTLVEYGSMTCPHCATFDEEGLKPLMDKYVKAGQVAFEFRNFVRDPADMAAALIARCGGADRFFPLTRQLFEAQEEWAGRIQSTSPEQYQQVMGLPQSQLFVQMAQLAGLQQWAAQRGVPSAQSSACLANEQEINRLVQMNADATTTYNVPGTPSFLLDGELLENTSSWETLEPKIREALR